MFLIYRLEDDFYQESQNILSVLAVKIQNVSCGDSKQ